MKKTILTCDRCKKEVDGLNQVAAGIRKENYSTYGGRATTINSPYMAEWCQVCCEIVGLYNYDPPPTPEQTQITLEELIREIIREEIDNK
jgi:hypothetical protein